MDIDFPLCNWTSYLGMSQEKPVTITFKGLLHFESTHTHICEDFLSCQLCKKKSWCHNAWDKTS